MNRLVGTLLATALLGATQPLSAQTVTDIMSGLRSGGGWAQMPIDSGRGSFSSVTLPTATLELAGCFNVWWGHSGSWTITATETVKGDELSIVAEPGVGVTFRHKFGMTAQLDVDVEWSEPRDTTLMLWIGLDFDGEGGSDGCDPWTDTLRGGGASSVRRDASSRDPS